jgi:site-specific DNA-methyltransferase (adenine-specific)
VSEPTLILGDCVEAMRGLSAESVDAVVTDPPYGIRFMGKSWDGADIEREVERRRSLGRDADGGDFGNGAQSAGIYDVSATGNRAFQMWTEAWAQEAYRVLKPGGHLLCFAGTRTYHRMVSGVEDAGFEIRDTLAWMYGSGFPKSHDVARAVDKVLGAEGGWRREDHFIRGGVRRQEEKEGPRIGQTFHASPENPDGLRHVYEPETEEARAVQGWGTALKPAFEPIVLARKPLDGTVAANVLAHGTGALNVDACRVAGPKGDGVWGTSNAGRDPDEPVRFNASPGREEFRSQAVAAEDGQVGRWPANVLLDEDAAEALDEQTEHLHAAGNKGGTPRRWQPHQVYGMEGEDEMPPSYGDSGGASRFFYCAKVSRAERNAGLEGFDAQPLNWSSGDASPGTFQAEGTDRTSRNGHPTVKPIALMRWLIRLVTPPGGVVLDPFLGSGTTGCAAAIDGHRFVGVEREPGYMRIAEARIRFWAEHGEGALDYVRARERADAAREQVAASGQLDLLADA